MTLSAFAGHAKAVSRIAMDPASTRILSASRDYTMHMYDFGGMKADMKAFRTLNPFEGHPVLAASWSTTGDTLSLPKACMCILRCMPLIGAAQVLAQIITRTSSMHSLLAWSLPAAGVGAAPLS